MNIDRFECLYFLYKNQDEEKDSFNRDCPSLLGHVSGVWMGCQIKIIHPGAEGLSVRETEVVVIL